MEDWFKADVQFKVDGKKVEFEIVHNLPDKFGINFDSALDNWLARTEEFTDISFCNYVNSKNTGYSCYTMKQYNEMNN